jgi:exosortase
MIEGHERVAEDARAADRPQRTSFYCHLVVSATLFIFLFHRVLWRSWLQLSRGDEPWQIVFVPFLSGVILSQRLPQMRDFRFEKGSRWGVALILLGMLFHILGIAVQSFSPSQVAMVMMIQGIVLYAFGKPTYRFLFFPLVYLFLAIPPPPSVSVLVTGPLKSLSASLGSKGLEFLGVAVVRHGTILNLPVGTLSIADECSGLMSMLTLSIFSFPIGYLTQKSFGRKAIIFLASIPLAFASNVVRVIVTALLFQQFGRPMAEGFPHTAIGMVIVFVSFFLLYGFGLLISDHADKVTSKKNSFYEHSQ